MNTTYTYQHVLIIDNSKTDVLLLKEILTSLKYAETISTFENPVLALEFLKKCEPLPEIVFIDLNIPEMNGFKFIDNSMKEFSNDVKFIIVSSSDAPSNIKKSANYSNVIHYFIKPINKMDLELTELD